jgi:16S rRNA (guanine966-N2)-methyltransferase
VRITGGKFCGLRLKVPGTGDVRPTQDRVREALFSSLQCEVPGADFLDLFAGTGATGLEALSRGARRAVFVELDARHAAVISENISIVTKGAADAEVVRMDAYRYVAAYTGSGFDVVFADPPYRLGEEKGYGEFLALLAERGVVRPEGVFVAEMTAAQSAGDAPGWKLVRDRTYGKTRLAAWRRQGE